MLAVVGARTCSKTLVVFVACMAAACTDPGSGSKAPEAPQPETKAKVPESAAVGTAEDNQAAKLDAPVPVWTSGDLKDPVEFAEAPARGYLVLDLGEEWAPYILTDGVSAEGEPLLHTYRKTYLQLAKGQFPDNLHGERASSDKYLELYGILPTLGLLRQRFHDVMNLPCEAELDLAPLITFDGFLTYQRRRRSERNLARYQLLGPQMQSMVQRLGHTELSQVQRSEVNDDEWERIEEYRRIAIEVEAIMAAQQRLACEGYFVGREGHKAGVFDWRTHEALAEFERRHRIYGWGFLGNETLDALRKTPVQLERETVIRVLTERAMHAAGVIEDGSQIYNSKDEHRTFKNAKGQDVPLVNLEEQLMNRVIESFGLQTPESTYAWLHALGEIPPHYAAAIPAVELPEYYSGSMDLSVTVDRGDVWYEFPYDAEGKQRSQPVRRRPRVTFYTRYLDQRIPLARFGTTVGGWRSEYIDGTVMWKYKYSPIGDRVWSRIVAAPVWIPPETTPPRSLLRKTRSGYEVNYYETGPGYASAYGLVAAYHRKYWKDREGDIHIGGDEGIRTHGSVDYMSIMRRHSHGCHRMLNHLAVRAMSFVLNHRPHQRLGARRVNYERDFDFEEQTYTMEFDQAGYIFELDDPLNVKVLTGRVRGALREPIEYPLPKYDKEQEAYVMPDGSWVHVDRMGNLTPRQRPELEPPADPFEQFDYGVDPANPTAPPSPAAPVTDNNAPAPEARVTPPQVKVDQPTTTAVQ